MMAYDKDKLHKQAIKAITENNLYFIEDIITMLPCSKATFYEYFPSNSDELNKIKEMIEMNKVAQKVKMRKKWGDSDNATLQMALMKLISTDDERKRLAVSYVESKTTQTNVDLSGLSTDDILNILKEGDEE
jgi:hypothetical protein